MTVSLVTQRVLHQTTDISVAVSDFRVGTYAMSYVAGQYLYVGSCSPFNNLWLDMTTVSVSNAGTPTIQVWYNGSWVNVVDIIDQTSGMTASGRVSWSLDIDGGWNCEQKSETVGLTGTQIYNRYWLRFSWANNFTCGLGYVGQKFSTDSIMASLYPDLMQADILNGFKTGKTNWDEQHFMASEAIVKEIRKRNVALFGQQLMDWSVFEDAGCHKVAEIAYQAFGAPYADHAKNSQKRFLEELNQKFFVADVNKNGHLEPQEHTKQSGYMTR